MGNKNGSPGLGDEELEELKAQYTMDDERKVHDQVLVASSTLLPGVTMAGDHNAEKIMSDNEINDADNLGDNVELF